MGLGLYWIGLYCIGLYSHVCLSGWYVCMFVYVCIVFMIVCMVCMYGMYGDMNGWYVRLYICNNPASVANIPQRTVPDNNPSPAQQLRTTAGWLAVVSVPYAGEGRQQARKAKERGKNDYHKAQKRSPPSTTKQRTGNLAFRPLCLPWQGDVPIVHIDSCE